MDYTEHVYESTESLEIVQASPYFAGVLQSWLGVAAMRSNSMSVAHSVLTFLLKLPRGCSLEPARIVYFVIYF